MNHQNTKKVESAQVPIVNHCKTDFFKYQINYNFLIIFIYVKVNQRDFTERLRIQIKTIFPAETDRNQPF